MSRRKTTEEFINEARDKHGDKYDYSKFCYTNAHHKGIIICPIHGEFHQTPHEHLKGYECPKCGLIKSRVKQASNTIEFIEKAKRIHGDKYDYSKVNYVNAQTKVCIICPVHGEFWQTAGSHLCNHGCPECANDKMRLKYINFVNKANIKHNNRYSYPIFTYTNNHQYIDIECPVHGIFKQKIKTHLDGCGCPICNNSSLETSIYNLLTENHFVFTREQEFEWLIFSYPMKLDFYLPDYNIAIECQGLQHYKSIDYFGGEERLKKTQERDEKKYQLCKEHGIRVLYYSDMKNTDYKKLENVYFDSNDILTDILNTKPNQKEK